jgi:hypothetical protein
VSDVIKSLYVGKNRSFDNFFFFSSICVSNRNAVGRYERVFSDHFDFVTPQSFNGSVCRSFSSLFKYSRRLLFLFIGVVSVVTFHEDDPEQVYIPPRSFYRRYTFEYRARKLQVTLFPLLANFSLFTTTCLHSPNLDQKHVFARSLTCLKTSTL